MNHKGTADTAIIIGHPCRYLKAIATKLKAFGIKSKLSMSLTKAASSKLTKLLIIDLEGIIENQLQLLPHILTKNPQILVIILTSTKTTELSKLTLRLGASIQLDRESKYIADEIVAKFQPYEKALPLASSSYPSDLGIIGSSIQMQDIFNQIELVCHTDVNILILGESGTGKEMIARAIHHRSNRQKNQFEAINCAAIPDSLLESELFGHKRGAFTDARHDRQGLFERSSNGTLFLDEIGEISPMTQVKLLRVLQEREVRPLGCNHSIKIDTRVIAATNRNLEDQIKKAEFREDLYFRLAVIPIELPPLRERKEDIPSLISHFLNYYNSRYKLSVNPPSKTLYQSLLAYH